LSHARFVGLAGLLAVAVAGAANAQKKYDPGATDTEIKIGNIMPYSGPASAYATIGKTEAAYFNKINADGGINGRKINFISYDDGYSPPKAVEQARKLVEADEVLLIFNPLSTPSNSAIQKYMNAKKVPQIFVSSGAAKWNDPKNFPWTRRPGRRSDHVRLRCGQGARTGAAAVRRRSHPRKHHEAGSQSEFRNRRVSAGHAYQDQPDRLRAARAVADDAVQGRELGLVRADHVRRKEQLSRGYTL
jgi:hypothetical protein